MTPRYEPTGRAELRAECEQKRDALIVKLFKRAFGFGTCTPQAPSAETMRRFGCNEYQRTRKQTIDGE